MSRPFVVPEAIRELGPEAVERLETLVAAAELAQVRESERSLEATLRIVPRPLRGLVRKVLGA